MARRAMSAGSHLPALACNHCQQRAANYLSGFLVSRSVEFRPVHDLDTFPIDLTRDESAFGNDRAKAMTLAGGGTDVNVAAWAVKSPLSAWPQARPSHHQKRQIVAFASVQVPGTNRSRFPIPVLKDMAAKAAPRPAQAPPGAKLRIKTPRGVNQAGAPTHTLRDNTMSQIIKATLLLCHDDDFDFETTVVLEGTREQLDNTTIFDEPEYADLYIAGVDFEPNLWPMFAPGGTFCRLFKETPLYCIYENAPFTVPARFSFQATPALFQHHNAGWGDSFETLAETEEKALAAARANIEELKRTIEDLEQHLP